MVTKDNFTDIINNITGGDLAKAMEDPRDFILLEVSTTNAGYTVAFKSLDYDEEVGTQAYEEGMMCVDVDDFVIMCNDVRGDITNDSLLEYLDI